MECLLMVLSRGSRSAAMYAAGQTARFQLRHHCSHGKEPWRRRCVSTNAAGPCQNHHGFTNRRSYIFCDGARKAVCERIFWQLVPRGLSRGGLSGFRPRAPQGRRHPRCGERRYRAPTNGAAGVEDRKRKLLASTAAPLLLSPHKQSTKTPAP